MATCAARRRDDAQAAPQLPLLLAAQSEPMPNVTAELRAMGLVGLLWNPGVAASPRRLAGRTALIAELGDHEATVHAAALVGPHVARLGRCRTCGRL
jgi:hypothetical protein